MIGLLARFLPQILGGVAIISVLGVGWWKVSSYMDAHEELEQAYERQQLELSQAVAVNTRNAETMTRIQSEHAQAVRVLENQRTTEVTNRELAETQLQRVQRLMRDTEPEVVYVEGEACPPQYGVHPVLANPFGRVFLDPEERDRGNHGGGLDSS